MLINRVADNVHFEMFELSASNEPIVDTKGRLIRTFPGQAVAVPVCSLLQDDVMGTLVLAIGKMSGQDAAFAQPTAQKAGAEIAEVRHSTNPLIVTDYLSSILLTLGSAIEVSAINKKMREEVMYMSTKVPWFRSDTWLLFRVGLQLTMSRLEVALNSSIETSKAPAYKEFIAFLMAAILREAHKHDIESDLLSIMTSKISRRLRKLGGNASSWLRDYGSRVIRDTNLVLECRWKVMCKKDARNPDYDSLPTLNFHKDTFAALPDLDNYLEAVTQLDLREPVAAFAPNFSLNLLDAKKLPRIHASNNAYHNYNLASFESWIESSLDGWLRRNISNPSTCEEVCSVLYEYYGAAHGTYHNNPEAISLMILTCLELWIACNKSALNICPMLSEYLEASVQPSLVRALLQSLILPHKSQLERLNRIESYLDLCSSNSKILMPSVFDNFGEQNAFYVRYYNTSQEQQQLHNLIESQAHKARQEKRVELASLQSMHANLKAQADVMSCTQRVFSDRWGYQTTEHAWDCKRCKTIQEYRALHIEVHEWPLPKGIRNEQSVIFELAPPKWLPAWRDATIFLLFNVLSMSYMNKTKLQEKHELFDYEALRRHCSAPQSQKITAVSQAKSFLKSHYRTIRIDSITDDSQVLVNHGLYYEYFNSSAGVLAGPAMLTETIPRQCMLKLPSKDSTMQPFLYRPAHNPSGPPPNAVIASQHDCPQEMTLAEFRELCVLPLGFKLQWQNILRQLHAPSVDFNQLSTFVFHAQCITQAGPPKTDDILRASHAILADPTLSQQLMGGVVTATSRVAESWQSAEALRTFILIATRVLQLTTDSITNRHCQEYLASARSTVLKWAVALRDKARARDRKSVV